MYIVYPPWIHPLTYAVMTTATSTSTNNIHRLEEYAKGSWDQPVLTDWKVLDIPLDSRHGIEEPVALRFDKDYSKL